MATQDLSNTVDGGVSSELVLLGCNEACERIQLAADILLLQTNQPLPLLPNRESATQPFSADSESYGKSRDAIIASTKRLAISIKELTHLLEERNFYGVYKVMCSIASQVVSLIESATHAAYWTSMVDVQCKPAKLGTVNRYHFECARQTIHMCYEKFQPQYEIFHSTEILTTISKILADNIATLIHGCKHAAENKEISQHDRTQFGNCVQCLQGVTTIFLESLKCLVSSHSEEDCKHCLLFGKPLLSAVDMVIDFAKFPQFTGTPAILTQQGFESQMEIVGGAMAVVSSTVQLIVASKSVIGNSICWKNFANCSKAVAEASKLLSSSVREHSPRLSTVDQF